MVTSESRRRANDRWRKRNLEYIAETARQKYKSDENHRLKVKTHNLEMYHLKKEIERLMNISEEIFS
jgi:hypothetical protein